ncbi:MULTISPECIES: hypothetical protein [Methanothrix]|uniref:hypothetical protein n=1 Tax=Methanothrix TaxID=2222 RepID=UPI0012FE98C8|nr:hypothetical protein [Methanosaeta sp. UBA356]HPT38383.1 hypothetical protein [Methanothrix sp.]
MDGSARTALEFEDSPIQHRLCLIRIQCGIIILGRRMLQYGSHGGIVIAHDECLALDHIRLILFGYNVGV